MVNQRENTMREVIEDVVFALVVFVVLSLATRFEDDPWE